MTPSKTSSVVNALPMIAAMAAGLTLGCSGSHAPGLDAGVADAGVERADAAPAAVPDAGVPAVDDAAPAVASDAGVLAADAVVRSILGCASAADL